MKDLVQDNLEFCGRKKSTVVTNIDNPSTTKSAQGRNHAKPERAQVPDPPGLDSFNWNELCQTKRSYEAYNSMHPIFSV